MALNTIECLDLTDPEAQWQIIKGGELHKKGCFTMCPMYDLDLDYENIDVRHKVLIFGGWKPQQNLADIQMIDTKEEDYKNIGKFAKQLLRTKRFSQYMSASTAHESGMSS